jgi:glycosyltransferase involved in cell wall biosynthesis
MPAGKTLSICIPTYNRAEFLDRLLSSISKDSIGIESEFEVCISDNNSKDSTPSVVKKWARHLPIIYKRNRENVGFDANIVKVAKLARAEYIWFFGDDDVLANGALAGLIHSIKLSKKEGIPVIYVNCGRNAQQVERNFNFSKISFFPVKDFSKFTLNVFFMGVVCVSRELVHKIVIPTTIRPPLVIKNKPNPVYLFDFMHTYVLLEALARCDRFGIEPRCRMLTLHDGNDTDFEIFLHHFLNHALWLVHICRDYPWFKQRFFLDTLEGKYIRAVAVVRLPSLEGKYCLCRDFSLAISKINRDWLQEMQIRFFDNLRKNIIGKLALSLSFSIAKLMFKGIKIEPSQSSNQKMRIIIDLTEMLARKTIAEDSSPLSRKQLTHFEW